MRVGPLNSKLTCVDLYIFHDLLVQLDGRIVFIFGFFLKTGRSWLGFVHGVQAAADDKIVTAAVGRGSCGRRRGGRLSVDIWPVTGISKHFTHFF